MVPATGFSFFSCKWVIGYKSLHCRNDL